MNFPNIDQPPPKPFVFWIIWFAILQGLFILLFFAAGGFPEGVNEEPAPTGIVATCAGLALLAMVIRFLVIPKLRQITHLMTVMVIGLALSEAVGIISMFVLGDQFPETKTSLFIVSVSCVIAYAPIYVNGLLQRQRMR